MPTSGTGNCRRACPPAAQRGFSLLELLVVVAIIGIMAGAVAWSVARVDTRELSAESDRLHGLLRLLHEESLMQSRDYGVLFTASGYRFYIYDYQKLGWVEPADDRLLQLHELKPLLGVTLVLDGREVELKRDFKNLDMEKPAPQVMLLSSGELTPFTLEMSQEGLAARFDLTGELDGTLKVTEEQSNAR